MDHKLMQSLVAVAEELHFGRAAARLHISQPPLTKQIQQLEQVIGVRLLERTKRKVELTEAGRVFLEEARAVLHQTGQAVELARKAGRGETGHLSVGFIDAAIYSVVPAVVQRFTECYPEVALSLTDLRIPNQIKLVAERQLDIGFVHPPVVHNALQAESILVEPLIVALPETHWLASETEIALADLAQEALIQFPRSINPSLYDEIVGLCRSSGFSPRIVREATPKQTIIGLVSVGLGVSLLPACLENLQRSGVVYRPIRGRNLSIDTSIIYRREQPSPVLKAFLDIVRETTGIVPEHFSKQAGM
ncbi:MAG: LysR family transcriptional regulator [Mesorhizobium sp.]|nr:MAG: LysR family transcriptional regulator [Mesorhizobium sp.]